MKKFFFNILFLLLLLIAIDICFSFIIGRAYFKDYSEVSLNYDTYLLADSHGKALLDFMEENGVFNFSANSDSYLDIVRKVRFLVKNSQVNRIIIGVSHYTLSRYRESFNNLDRSVIFTTPDDFDSNFDFIKARYLKRYIAFFNAKSRDIIKMEIIGKFLSATGYYNKDWSELSEEERSLRANNRVSYLSDEDQSEALVSALEEIVFLCQSNQIELIGIKFPKSNAFSSLITWKRFYAADFIKGKGFTILDFTNIYKDNDNYFKDPDHLNEIGATKFADTLLKSISNYTQTYNGR
jgi:hypothetical protein